MLSSRHALAAGVAAVLLLPAAVVLAQPSADLPPAPRPPGQQAADAGSPATAPGAAAPPATATASGSAAPAPPPAASAPARAPAAPGAPPAAPPGYPYPYPPAHAPARRPPPPQGYPPPGYPPPGYPPPGYGYPPGYAEQPAPPAPPEPKRPPHDAASRSPFFDGLAGSVVESDRFDDFLGVGGEVGLFVASRLRLSARILTFVDQPSDNYSSSGSLGAEYSPIESHSPTLLWGGSAGFAAVSTSSFLLSPGVLFMRTDVSDYGSFIGVNVPFVWVKRSGVRMGFELALGRSFGGTVVESCSSTVATPSTPCAQGFTNEINRSAGSGFYAAFVIGWGIGG